MKVSKARMCIMGSLHFCRTLKNSRLCLTHRSLPQSSEDWADSAPFRTLLLCCVGYSVKRGLEAKPLLTHVPEPHFLKAAGA